MPYIALPAFRAPGPLDFSGLNEGIDTYLKNRERNRLLEEAKAVGQAAMVPAEQAAAQANPLLPSPAQASAAAAGRDDRLANPYGNAISSIESGGRYHLVGPMTKGDRPYGKYQVMGANIGPWTQEILGRRMTPQEFLRDTKAQDDVFNAKFGEYVRKTGNPQDAASMWHSGVPLAQAQNRKDILGTRTTDYVNRFTKNLGGTQAAPVALVQPSGPNYRAAANVAFSQGNVALGQQLLQQQQELDNQAYTRNRATQQDAIEQQRWEAGYGLQSAQNQRAEAAAGREAQTFDDAQEKAFIGRAGTIAQTIRNEPDEANRRVLWQRVVASHPRWEPFLAQYGIDRNDVENGTKFLISMAGLNNENAEFGTTPQPYYDAQGNLQYTQLSKTGGRKDVQLPPNARWAPAVKPVDQGTQTALVGPGGQQLVSPLPKDVAGEAQQKKVGEGKGEAQVDLPRVQSNSDAILAQIDSVLNDPYLPSMTGPLQGRLPNVSGEANRVQSKVDQLTGQAFLQAFTALRGGGAITEIEGAKATAALARVQNMNVNDKDYPAALRDFRNEVLRLRQLAETKAGVSSAPIADPAVTPSANAPVRVNTPDEAMALPPGTQFQTPDGRIKVRP